jgi:2-polyprenyl-3-methyl-5-hydroxy-6-metoxy-1,4-benzoquinol methylase
MYLTAPQSSHYDRTKFEGRSPRENHFDWELYYRFKDERERFWRARVDEDAGFRAQVADHFAAFQRSIETTLRLLAGIESPRVLDIGLSSEQLDRAILKKTRGQVAVLDVQQEAERSYERAFGGRGSFILGDVISVAREGARAGEFDLVYSVGLLEHFPDKSDILDAHVSLTKPGGVVLIYAPIHTEANRTLTTLVPEWENFGHRELLTPGELQHACTHPELDILAAEAVGFFSAVWARKKPIGS